jgi:class 3 adenylate cyclase
MPTPAGPNKNPLGDRRLAAIVFTDVAGFSGLMEKNEHHTLLLIKRDLKLIGEVCRGFGGDVLKNTGDGCLTAFPSVEAAVGSAIKIQRIIADATTRLPPQEILHHRIGIHLGDVFVGQGDVLGNGVNIAARLLGEAEPDGICISQTVYDLVKSRLDFKAICIGARELKNIREAVQVYRVVLNAVAEEQNLLAAHRAGHRRLILAATLFAVATIGIATWFIVRSGQPRPANTAATTLPAPIIPATLPAVAATTNPAPILATVSQPPTRKPDFTVDSTAAWDAFKLVSTESLSTTIEYNAYVMSVQSNTFRICIAPTPWPRFEDVTIEAIAKIHGPLACSWGLELLAADGPRKVIRMTIASGGLLKVDLSRLNGIAEPNLPLNPNDIYLFRDPLIHHIDSNNTVLLVIHDHDLSVAVNGKQFGPTMDITSLGPATTLLTIEGSKGAVATFEKLRAWFPHSSLAHSNIP